VIRSALAMTAAWLSWTTREESPGAGSGAATAV